ncbi:MAG: hypothetical protein RIS25_1043 [Actinomycetota bacterium]|jgi:hypothetical protein
MKTYTSVVERYPIIAFIAAGVFGISVVVGTIYTVVTWAYLNGSTGFDDAITMLAEFDDVIDYGTVAANLLVTVTLIVVLYRFTSLAAGSTQFTGKHTPYMAIVGSLVPILSLFWPLRMYRALINETAESGRADMIKLSLQFWIPWAGSGLISAQAFRMETTLRLAGEAFDIGTFVVVLVAWLFSDILTLVAVLRARVFFAKLASALDAA